MLDWGRKVVALALLVAGALAVKVQHGSNDRGNPTTLYGDMQHKNLIFSPNATHNPGSFELMRMPRELSVPALLSIRGTFDDLNQPEELECHGLYMKNLTIKGDWLDGKVVHVQWKNSTLRMKVSSPQSSTRAAFAGPWRPTGSFIARQSGESEELPSAVRVFAFDNNSLLFKLGPKDAEAELALFVMAREPNLQAVFFNASKLALVNESQDEQVNRNTEACMEADGPQYAIGGYHHSWHLGAATLALGEKGTHELLRLPKEASKPAVLRLLGTVEPSVDAPCGLSLTSLTFDGAWFGGEAALQVSLSPGIVYRVTAAASEGEWEPLENFEVDDDYSTFKGLPDTVKILTDEDDSDVRTGFRLYVGPWDSLDARPLIAVSRGTSGLTVSYIKKLTTQIPDMGKSCHSFAALNALRTKLYREPGLHLSHVELP